VPRLWGCKSKENYLIKSGDTDCLFLFAIQRINKGFSQNNQQFSGGIRRAFAGVDVGGQKWTDINKLRG